MENRGDLFRLQQRRQSHLLQSFDLNPAESSAFTFEFLRDRIAADGTDASVSNLCAT